MKTCNNAVIEIVADSAIQITIQGSVGSGKTRLLNHIGRFLKDQGYNVVGVDGYRSLPRVAGEVQSDFTEPSKATDDRAIVILAG